MNWYPKEDQEQEQEQEQEEISLLRLRICRLSETKFWDIFLTLFPERETPNQQIKVLL